MLSRSMLIDSNKAAVDMVQKLDRQNALKGAQAQSQQLLRTAPASPGANTQKAKVKRGMFGFGFKKGAASMKNLSSNTSNNKASPGSASIEGDSNHTGGAPTVTTEEGTKEPSLHSLRSHDSPGTLSSVKKQVTMEKPPRPTTTKKSKKKSQGKLKHKKETVVDKQQSNDAPTTTAEEERKAKAVGVVVGGDPVGNYKENIDSSLRSSRSNDHISLKESSSRSNRSGDHHHIKESSSRSNRSHDVDVILEEGGEDAGSVPGGGSGSVHSGSMAGSKSPGGDDRRRRPRRMSPRAGTIPKFLLGDGASLSGKEHEQVPMVPEDQAVEQPATIPEAMSEEELLRQQPAIVEMSPATFASEPISVPASAKTQLGEAAELLYYEEELMSATSASRGLSGGPGSSGVGDAPQSPRKKSILKGTADQAGAPVRTIAAGIHNHSELQQTIVITRDDSDAVTCLTMDDFESKTNRPRGRVKRKGRVKGAAGLNESEHSSKDAFQKQANKLANASGGLSDAGLAEILRKDIHSKKEGVLIAGLDAIKEFASKGSKQRSKVCAFGAIPSILRVLDNKKTTTHNVLLSAVGALSVVAKDARNQETACELGAIPTISLAVQRNLATTKVVAASCKTLEMLTSCMRLANADAAEDDRFDEISTQGAMTVLSCCLMTHPKDKDIVQYTIGCITNICMFRPHLMQMLSEAGGIAAMTAALSKKWKSKTRKTQAQKDLQVIVASVGASSSDEDDHDDSSEQSDDNDEEEEEDDDDEQSFEST